MDRNGIQLEYAFCSDLERGVETATILRTLNENMSQVSFDIELNWRLNERHFGELTGIKENNSVSKYGYDPVNAWLTDPSSECLPMVS
jgi:2,3-bisphosphoglycerate-dependent phosphoglycerate mutase